VATTGGTGTGLTANVAAGGGGYINISLITIANPGTGYTDGDVITIDNENNLPGTFQIGIAANNWTFGTDGSLFSNEFKIKTLNGIPTSIGVSSQDTQLWDYNYGSDLATTGGSGTGLTVNVGDGGSGYAGIAINEPGTGYSPGDVITVTNGPVGEAPYASTVTFTIGVSGTRNWTFDRYGKLLKQISGTSEGWNGTFNGNLLPSNDYWFEIKLANIKSVKGHFTLKR
jgi:gliding motility-associated-like protein